MTRLLAIFAFVLIALPAVAAGPIAVVEEPIQDAGRVIRGEPVEYVFEIANHGDAPLEVVDVVASCGCTVTSAPSAIGPGAMGRVQVTMHTSALAGPLARSVEVITNDPQNPRIRLTLKAEIREPVLIQPDYVRFRHVVGEQAVETGLTLSAPQGESLTVREVSSPWPFVRAEVRPTEPEERLEGIPGPQWRILVTLASDAPAGPFTGHLTILTDHPERPRVEVPVSGLVRSVLEAIPTTVDWGERPASEPLDAVVAITRWGTGSTVPVGVESELPGLTAEIEPAEEEGKWHLSIHLPPGDPGQLDSMLRVRTSNPEVPAVPVRLLVVRR